MDFIVPIYTADIEMAIVMPSINRNTPDAIVEVFRMENMVVKGFSISDIKERMHHWMANKAMKIKKLGKNQVFKIENIHLLRQHGYGIND